MLGHLTGTTYWQANGSSPSTSDLWYDTGEVYKHIDANLNYTQYGYSPTYYGGYRTSVTNALGQTTTFTYDLDLGLKTGMTDPSLQTTSYGYDNYGRLTSVQYPDAAAAGVAQSLQYTHLDAIPANVTVSKAVTTPTAACPANVNGYCAVKEEVDVDGFGLETETKLLSDPGGRQPQSGHWAYRPWSVIVDVV